MLRAIVVQSDLYQKSEIREGDELTCIPLLGKTMVVASSTFNLHFSGTVLEHRVLYWRKIKGEGGESNLPFF